jgi:hypothetical protein
MRHARSLGFDNLEARQLLSKIHHAASPPAEVAAPLSLAGTLVANHKLATISTDAYGDQTTITPVAGVLAGVGMVRGSWDESTDMNGNYLGPDSIQLHNNKGTFVIGFDATTVGQAAMTPQGMVYNGAAIELVDGTGAYAEATTSGFLQMNTNARQTVVTSLTLTSGTSS